MKCLYFDLPINTRVDDPDNKPLSDILKEIGGNTGNLLFRHAIRLHLEDELVPAYWPEGAELGKAESYDALVLAGANWLHTAFPFGNDVRARVIRELGLPVICIGLGVQNPVTTHEKLAFPDETVDFLNALREVNALVLTRDEMTRMQCRHYGLETAVLTGCPSNFINPSPTLEADLVARFERGHFKHIVLNAGHMIGPTLQLDRCLWHLVEGHPGRYLIQSNDYNVLAMSLNRPTEYSAGDVRSICKAFKLGGLFRSGKAAFPAWREHLRSFLDIEKWLESAQGWDIAIGTRIHGTMAAIQAGTPALLVTSDSRTAGLAEVMKIPNVPLEKALSLGRKPGLADLLAAGPVDWSAYFSNRVELARRYLEQLEGFGLEPSGIIRSIARL